jgi:uncharacterized protein YbjT (DUF2867 family)
MDVVTGGFSYTGRAIAEELLRRGRQVRTLTRRDARGDPLAARLEQASLQFRDGEALRHALEGVEVLYNTYWVRFERGATTFERAIANTRVLLHVAREAGAGRVVHVSVSNPTIDSPLPYFRSKAQVEADVSGSGLAHAIVRPTLVFGANDILVNNIAWGLRRSPIFPIAGDGSYCVQPVAVEDVATICVDAGESAHDVVLDAAGPDTFTYGELVKMVAQAVGSRSKPVHLPSRMVLALAWTAGAAHRDVALTADELAGLEAGLLVSQQAPLGRTRFGAWIAANGKTIGRNYVAELERNFRAQKPL